MDMHQSWIYHRYAPILDIPRMSCASILDIRRICINPGYTTDMHQSWIYHGYAPILDIPWICTNPGYTTDMHQSWIYDRCHVHQSWIYHGYAPILDIQRMSCAPILNIPRICTNPGYMTDVMCINPIQQRVTHFTCSRPYLRRTSASARTPHYTVVVVIPVEESSQHLHYYRLKFNSSETQ